MKYDNLKLSVIGLGYVGLPLAVEFGKQIDTVGFDVDEKRVQELRNGHDRTRELSADEMAAATRLTITADKAAIANCNAFIVTVPTPVDADNRPDFSPLIAASRTVGSALKCGDVVIYESTVYPGATEEVCVPELERASGLKFNKEFFVGYSPERINPGDKERRLTTIPKVTSGSTPEIADWVDGLYKRIITAGTHKAPSLKVAEASKVIENTQRDVNIALMNEFALIFHRLGIDTHDVLAAAGTKWNFLPFKPGLVGGHCIGVDPYYLIQKAQSTGYYPDILIAARRVNDAMGSYVAGEVVKLMVRRGQVVKGARVLVMGLAFKENCADLRNTRVAEIVEELQAYGASVDVYDPLVSQIEAQREYGITLIGEPQPAAYSAIILAVAHEQFCVPGSAAIRAWGVEGHVLYDLKNALPRGASDLCL